MGSLKLSSCVSVYADLGRVWLRVIEKDGCTYEAELGATRVQELVKFLGEHAGNTGTGLQQVAFDEDVWAWCCTEGTPYSLKELGDDAWLTGCPLCGSSDCGLNLTPAQIAERDEFYGKHEKS